MNRESREGKPAKILVVQGGLIEHRVVTAALADLGHHVFLSAGPNEVLAFLNEMWPDLVILDCSRPDIEQILALLRTREGQGLSSPILLVTDKTSSFEARLNLRRSVDDVLTVPLAQFELRNKAESLLSVRRVDQKAKARATHDSLTHCFNRTSLSEQLERLVKAAQTLKQSASLGLIGIENFNVISAQEGLEIAKSLLVHVAFKLQDFFGPLDCVGRVDVDRFGVVMPNTNISAVNFRLEGLAAELQAFSWKEVTPENRITPRFVFGSASFPGHTKDVTQLFCLAEMDLVSRTRTLKDISEAA